MLMFLLLIHSDILEEVQLVFMVPGHSYLPCDAGFGTIETQFKKKERIETPAEYNEIIQGLKEVSVQMMNQDDFLDWKFLYSLIKHRTGQRIMFSKARQITLSRDHKWQMKLQRHQDDADHEFVNLMKAGTPDHASLVTLLNGKDAVRTGGGIRPPMKYNQHSHIKISDSKKQDLIRLKRFMNPTGVTWADEVIAGQATAETHEREADDP